MPPRIRWMGSGIVEYQRIDENTIRCIVTEEDMQNFGLNLDEFLTHSKKSDEFLRYIVDEARDELGYKAKHGLVSMRVEILQDGRISITFANSDENALRAQMVQRLKTIFPDINPETMDSLLAQLSGMSETDRKSRVKELLEDSAKASEKSLAGKKAVLPQDPYRLCCFASLSNAMAYSRACGIKQPVKSHFFKANDKYYLVIDHYRISEAHFNKMTAVAFEYGQVIVEPEEMYQYLQEHGELLIEDRALGILRKIG